MAKNVIFYGPPGTGKTYEMQRLMEKYTDYEIVDEDIYDAYMVNSEDWLLIALLLLQNNAPMRPSKILDKISTLLLNGRETVSDVLEEHGISDSAISFKRTAPRIFWEAEGSWFVDRLKLLEYDANFMTKYMRNSKVAKRYAFVSFHQSFAYEDFVEGIRPTVDGQQKALIYETQPGIFKRICEEAHFNATKQYALFIDEINRGNVSEIFGELISLIEVDKREGQCCELSAVLPYSKESFRVPSNLDLFSTMNSADKSVASMDTALRRRFDFVAFSCDYQLLQDALSIQGIDGRNVEGIDVIRLLKALNARIELLFDANHILGHAYFMGVASFHDILRVLRKNVIPLLEEYFFDDLQKIQIVFNDIDNMGELVRDPIYCHRDLDPDRLLCYTGDYMIETKRSYYLNAVIEKAAVIKVYEGVI